ncbi:hypothetical protein AB0383_16785 [Amycolatopsis sp. NPDC051373]|uniref:hypothetical protein n=1 Tax=Amycolatopsis sp. NPDC051373 TaxID=3155801 RepID=UPI00344BA592
MNPRGLAVARAAWGGALLTVARVAEEDEVAMVLVALGVRHLVQATVTLKWPHSAASRWAWLVDGAHSVSMLALAGASKRWRTPAMTSAATAAAWALVSRTTSK